MIMIRSITIGVVAALFVIAAVADDTPTDQSRGSHQEWMAKLGYHRHSGGWRTVQEIEIIERNEKTALAQKQWNKKLERLRQDLATGAAADAAEELAEITDPQAVPALTAALASDPLRRVRLLYMESLLRIGTPAAQAALVAAAVDHPDPETRIDATDRLAKLAPQAAANALVAALTGPDNARINRAAAVLGRLGVATVVPRLVNVLETRHVVTVGDGPPEGSTTATFTPSGGAGLSMGSSRRQVAVPMKNEQVLEALVRLTGENFGWDLTAWRGWLARQRAPASIDLRRG
jgi:HEAT repeat protein